MYIGIHGMAEVRRAEWEELARERSTARYVASRHPVRRGVGMFLIKTGNRLLGSAEHRPIRNSYASR